MLTLESDITIQNKDKNSFEKLLKILLNFVLNNPKLNIFGLLGIDLSCKKDKKIVILTGFRTLTSTTERT